MYCEKCGAKLEDGAEFCSQCGASMTRPAELKDDNPTPIKRKKQKRGAVIALIIVVAIIYIGITSFVNSITGDSSDSDTSETTAVEQTHTEDKPLNFLDSFTEYGYTPDQIEGMRAILTNVGITEITDLEIGNFSYGMQTVEGIAFKDTSFGGGMKEVQVRFNIENGAIYLVHIYCPSYMHENQIPYLSGLTGRRADLYYDAEGGYLKKIDWKNQAVVDYEK